MAEIRQKVKKSSLKSDEGKRLKFVLGENSIANKHLKPGCVTISNLSDDIIDALVGPVLEGVLEEMAGDFVVNKFGNSLEKTISQKLLTDTVNDIYGKLREMNGEPPVGLYMKATPEYFIGEEGSLVKIEAISTSGVFEHVAFYVDDVLIPDSEAEYVYRHSCETVISDTAVIKCVATIMGIDYQTEKTIRHYSSFWLGAGADYTDVMNNEHSIPVENQIIRGAYNVTCNTGDHIIIIVGSAFKDSFIRADLNGFEIPMTVTKITVGGNDYWVYTSDNVYVEGVYNIDING